MKPGILNLLEPQSLSRDCCTFSRINLQSTLIQSFVSRSYRPEINIGLQEVGTREEQSKQVKSFQVATSKYVTGGGGEKGREGTGATSKIWGES